MKNIEETERRDNEGSRRCDERAKKWEDNGKGCLVISWRVRGFRHVCLITFQLTRQSATPLSASRHPENYSFILEQLRFPMFRVPRYSLFLSFLFPFARLTLFLLSSKSILTRSVLESSFFQPFLVASSNLASERIRLFRSIKPYRHKFYPSGFGKPVVQVRKLNECNGNKDGSGKAV